MHFLLSFFLDSIFPSDQQTRHIESLGVEHFIRLARRSPKSIVCKRTYSFDEGDIFYLYSYQNRVVKNALWQLKYRNSRELAAFLAQVIFFEIKELFDQFSLLSAPSVPLCIPVPLSKKRLQERGYNHSELLAKELLRLLPRNSFLLSLNSLKKARHTPRQASIRNRSARLSNVKDCYSADTTAIQGKNIILIDDVVTTGATIREAAVCLRHAGAKKVISVVLAH